MNKSYWAL